MSRARLPSSKTSPMPAIRSFRCRDPASRLLCRFRGGCSSSASHSCFCCVWTLAGAVRHVVFIFLVALLIALLLNPLVRGLGRVWIPRGLAVAIVYVSFAAVAGTRDPRSRNRRGPADAARQPPRRFLLYDRVRTHPRDRSDAGSRPPPALAQQAPLEARQRAEAGTEVPQVGRHEGRARSTRRRR